MTTALVLAVVLISVVAIAIAVVDTVRFVRRTGNQRAHRAYVPVLPRLNGENTTMLDISTILWLIAGFGFLLVVGALLGAGTDASLAGLFPQSGARDWPQGVQETDVPRFAVEHLDALARRARKPRTQPVSRGL